MPNRIIRESARTSPTLARLSDGAERLFWRLITVADDYGRFDANPRVLLGQCFPLVDVKLPMLIGRLRELIDVEAISLYSVEDRQYGVFVAWEKSQRKRDSKPKFPDPPQSAVSGGELPRAAADCRLSESRIRESRDESRETRVGQNGLRPPTAAAPTHTPAIVFTIPEDWLEAIRKAPSFRAVKGFQNPSWWQAELRANHGVRFEDEIPKAQAYLLSHPERHYKDYVRFLHGWFGRADRVTA